MQFIDGRKMAKNNQETRQRMNGLDLNEAAETLVLDTQGNQTSISAVIDYSNVTMSVTTDVPESSLDAVDSYLNGLLQSRTTTSISTPTLFTYDDLARKITQKAPRHTGSSEWIYDVTTGQLVTQKDAAGKQTNYTYHSQNSIGAGRIATITDALGQVGSRAYNLRGQLVRKWGETDYPVEFTYNEFGEQTDMTTFRSGDDLNLWTQSTWPVTPPAGDTTTWVYDETTGLLTAKTDAASESVTYDYTTAGRMSDRDWARLDTQSVPLNTSYAYSQLTGERTTVDYADSTADISYTFDRLGRLDVVTDATGSREFEYSADLQLESETIAAFYGANKQITRTYESGTLGTDVVGRYTGFEVGIVSDPDADYAATYGFDGYGRLNSVTDQNDTFSYGYLANSNLIETMTSPVHTTNYSYEANRDVKTVVNNAVSSVSVSKYTYAYDDIRRRTSRVQEGSAFAQNSFDAFDYNSRSEVVGSERYLGTETGNTTSPVVADTFGYEFDPIGNRIESTKGVAAAETYTTNELNQYTAIGGLSAPPSHDADGNLTEQGDWIYKWNAENRLIEAYSVTEDTKLEFVYDYLGRRVEKKVSVLSTAAVVSEERFLYDGWNLIAVYDPANASTLVKTQTWGFDLTQTLQGGGGVGGLLGVEELSGTHQGPYTFAFDANGNVSEVLDNTGAVAAHYEYSPFGEVIRSNGTYADANAFRFSTKYWDEETEFYYYGYRHYDPAMGRWLNKDPLEEEGGLNLYAMVNNSAIGFFDYLGLSVCKRSWWDKLKKGFDDYVIEPGKAGLQGGAAYVDQFIPGSPLEKAGAYDPSNPLLQSSIGIGKGIDLATSVTGVKGLVKGGIEAGIKQGAKHADKAASALSKGAKGRSATNKLDNIPTGFKGSKGFELKNSPNQPVRNAPGEIGGREFTGHAFDQMQNRGIMPSVVEDAIQNGTRSSGNLPGTTVNFNQTNNISVITDTASGRVITVRPGNP